MSILSNHTKDMFLRRFYYPMRAPPYLFDWHTIQPMAHRDKSTNLYIFFSNLQNWRIFKVKVLKKIVQNGFDYIWV